MGLAVAGLKPEDVNSLTEKLASGNWADLPASHQAAFVYARKQALNPGKLTSADLKDLEKYFGPEKMWHVVWWSARCHYMTRVADAFQLPLEKENVFFDKPVKLKKK